MDDLLPYTPMPMVAVGLLLLAITVMVGRISVVVVDGGELKFAITVGTSVLGTVAAGASVGGTNESSMGVGNVDMIMVDGGIDEDEGEDDDKSKQNSWLIDTTSSFVATRSCVMK